ncbi:HAD family hydrolase [Candidatus Omnitrophota bacterium]
MGDSKIEAVIFDLGNVLIDFDHTPAVVKVAKFSDKTPQKIFDLFFDSEATGLFEEGKLSGEQFFQRIRETINLKMDYAGFLPIWNDIFFFSDKNRAVYGLAKAVKRKFKTVLLSNTNAVHFDYVRKKFPVFDAFDHIFTSYELGMRKPQPAIYEEVIKDIGVTSPANVFYTDDRKELIEGANQLGIRGFVFKDVAGLKKDLESVGIDTDEKSA